MYYARLVLIKNTKLLNIRIKIQLDKPHTYDELIQHLIQYNRKALLNDEEQNGSNRKGISSYDISLEECRTLCGLIPDHIEDIARIIHENLQHIFEFLTICRQKYNSTCSIRSFWIQITWIDFVTFQSNIGILNT